MNFRALAKDTLTAFAAQGVSFVASVVTALFMPKVLGVTAYGYWQLFIFYSTYGGFFHLGLNDGVYLVEGGKTRDQIDKKAINSQFRVGIGIQVIMGLLITVIATIISPGPERTFVLLSFAFYTVLLNLSAYLGYVFQAVNETKLFSFMTMLERFAFLVPMVVFLVLGVESFEPYVIAYIGARACALLYTIWHARDFLAAGAYSASESIRMSIASIKVGICLMLANTADMLILGVARGIIDLACGIEAFGRVSFSLSLVNFFISFVSQAAMVLFPALRQGSESERRAFYMRSRDLMQLAFPVVYLLYFPIVWLLSYWLPQYADSLYYFAILLPICVFNTKMNITCTTYFKVLRMERTLLKVNIVTVLASLAFSLIGVYVFESIDAVLLAAVIAIAGRSLWSEHRLNKLLEVPGNVMSFEELLLTVLFISDALLLGGMAGLAAYAVCYAVFLLLNKKEAGEFIDLVRHVMAKRRARG